MQMMSDGSGAGGGDTSGFNFGGLNSLSPFLGALAGGMGQSTNQNTNSYSTVGLQDFSALNRGASGLENAAYSNQLSGLQDYGNLVSQGPGAAEVSANNQFQNSYAGTLQGLMNQIANPTATSIADNFAKAQQLFAPQQTALNQQFQQAGWQNQQLEAKLGRAGSDPILNAKLAQYKTNQQNSLNSQIGSYGMQLPYIQAQQTMDVGGALSNLRQGLATQAFQNRQMLMGLGQNMLQNERNYRLGTASRNTSTDQSQNKGGGMGGALTGFIGALGGQGGLSGMASGIASMF